MNRVIIAILLSIILLAGVGYQQVTRYLDNPLAIPGDELIFVVEPGYSIGPVTRELEKSGVLKHPLWLKVYARFTGKTTIRAGEYRLTEQLTPLKLLEALNRGDVVERQVTLVEGRTFRQACDVLDAADKLKKILTKLTNQQLLDRLGIKEKYPEGLFFPDTYQYTREMSDVDILQQAYQRMQKVLTEEWDSRDSDLPYRNAYEALIMASIVEKETGVPEERSAIAGVFVRRLQKGMKLQTDPTVIYGLGDAYKGNITRKHLLQDTPYNTYTRPGLPPTPIALPGREAIHAAMHPQQGDSLFFVGRGDGHHYFSATLAEHERAVRQYQLSGRKKDYRSTPDSPARAQ